MQTTVDKDQTSTSVSPEAFAAMQNISRTTVYRMLRRGDLVAAKVGGQWRIDVTKTLEKLGF